MGPTQRKALLGVYCKRVYKSYAMSLGLVDRRGERLQINGVLRTVEEQSGNRDWRRTEDCRWGEELQNGTHGSQKHPKFCYDYCFFSMKIMEGSKGPSVVLNKFKSINKTDARYKDSLHQSINMNTDSLKYFAVATIKTIPMGPFRGLHLPPLLYCRL